jgi:hypothetical protein
VLLGLACQLPAVSLHQPYSGACSTRTTGSLLLLLQCGTDESGTISLFKALLMFSRVTYLQQPRALYTMLLLQCNSLNSTAALLLQMFDFDQSGTISLDEALLMFHNARHVEVLT